MAQSRSAHGRTYPFELTNSAPESGHRIFATRKLPLAIEHYVSGPVIDHQNVIRPQSIVALITLR